MTDIAETRPSRYRGLKAPWQPGQSGNPAGRPRGSRHKLCEDFIADMQAAWEARGQAALEQVIDDTPADFVKAMVSLMPKQVEQAEPPLGSLSDDELGQLTRYLEVIRSQKDNAVQVIEPPKE